jgi:hypothetical protein
MKMSLKATGFVLLCVVVAITGSSLGNVVRSDYKCNQNVPCSGVSGDCQLDGMGIINECNPKTGSSCTELSNSSQVCTGSDIITGEPCSVVIRSCTP